MTQKDAFAAIRAVNMTVRKTDGEYRVNFLRGAELSAYYTDDLGDAVATARRMRSEFNAAADMAA